MSSSDVRLQVTLSAESFGAELALGRPDLVVNKFLVAQKSVVPAKRFRAEIALKDFAFVVDRLHVLAEVHLAVEGLATSLARAVLQPLVDVLEVTLQV